MEERPPIRRVAASILNKQSGEPTRVDTPAWGLGDVRQLLTVKMYHVTKLSPKRQIWTDTVVRPKQRKRT
jgi:hypothetical protein